MSVLIGGEDKINKRFGPDVSTELGKTVSVCVETVDLGGKKVMAIPHCFSSLHGIQKFAVKPGQILLDIQYSPRLIVDDYNFCKVKYIVPKQSKECLLIFYPSPRDADITPKPSSDFGKSMITP